VSHPSLGLPPLDTTAGDPAAAARIRADIARISSRALESALAGTKGMRERYDEDRLRYLLRQTQLMADRIALCVASADPTPAHEYAESTVPVYRRRQVPLDDMIAVCRGLGATLPIVLTPAEMPAATAAIDQAIAAYKWHRRLAGDARKKNALLQFLYKGG
jgi:hypothetical protein